MIIYDAQTAEVKSTDSLAPKENSPSENSPAHGNTKIGVFRARLIFWEEWFAFLSQGCILGEY